ncbi:DNA methyltransferase [Salinibacter ruber]|uniref:DNA methyltransferase n=1 Tax=Salinibacter ruber TaxID=146919 RepID=UPI00216A6D6E|nr:site-specific DNA-methyltransferase [Salinibacter ruber]
MASEAFENLRSHLRSMFQFDDTELDFGIYKVLKLKRQEIERFIDEELPEIVQSALEEVEVQQRKQYASQVSSFVKEKGGQEEIGLLDDLEANRDEIENFIRYKSPEEKNDLLTALREATANGAADDLETRIYNHILRFFQRYYREGDFGYNDRSLQSYQVEYPDEADYDGSDVLFHWKHKDSYYIKTGQGFHSVAFEIDGERIKYVVEQRADDIAVAQNTNKDDRKHYELDRIEPVEEGQEAGTWRVVFHLAEESTPKAEVFQRLHDTVFGDEVDYETYLFRGERPIFTDLEGDYDEVSGGQKKGASGRQSLRLSPEKYSKRLVKSHRDVFEDLGSNDDKRIAALTEEIEQGTLESLPCRFYTFDKNLNTFYIGQDSDYFIHKHLGRFLSREKERYVKNVIFSDLEAVLNMQVDNTSVVIARAFDRVASHIIDLLAAVEDFQKHLFLLKKKVIDTNYLVSIGKIDEVVDDKETLRDLIERIVDEPKQIQEWQSTFDVDPPAEPMQLVINHPTLPVDTAHFDRDKRLKDDLLAQFDDLEAMTDGLLMNSENLQALRLIKRTYSGSIDYSYLDPPFNTGPSEILYKNNFRHSSWLSLMKDRLKEGKKLLSKKGVCTIAIDDFELPKLCELSDRVFENYDRNMVVVNHHPQGSGGDNVSRTHEYALFMTPSGLSILKGRVENEDEVEERPYMRSGTGERNFRYGRPNSFYAILVDPKTKEVKGVGKHLEKDEERPKGETEDGLKRVYPIGGNGQHRVWRNTHSTGKKLAEEDDLICTDNLTIYKLVRDKSRSLYSNWTEKRYNAGTHGTTVIRDVLGDADFFSYPKSIYTVIDSIRSATKNINEPLCIDYFAGSGTTGHAVLRMNKDSEDEREFILVEMGEYFDDVLKERIRRVLYSENWSDGTPDDEVDGTVGLVKYQRLEQYEDVLNNLEANLNGDALPDEVPLTYLYRPQEQALRTSLDLSDPFNQKIKYGPQQEEGTLDLLETYAYLKGLPVRQRRRYDRESRVYRTLRSDRHLVVFRPIQAETDDTDVLRDLLEENEGVEVLHVNHDVQHGELEQPRLNLRVVTAEDFDAGTSWT